MIVNWFFEPLEELVDIILIREVGWFCNFNSECMKTVESEPINEKEEELLRLVASLIVQIILNQEDECDRVHTDQ